MIDLAIVIPAYKAKYFAETLDSLARQTNRNFNLYIGDDCSPEDLKGIVDRFKDKLNISYTRFADNIGAKKLVEQWKRCIDLVSGGEKWLWLFSDDDIADVDCVENFYFTLQQKKDRFDVYRFNTVTIDKNGNTIRVTPTGPEEESSEEMAFHLLNAARGNSMPDHIFSRALFQRYGFVSTDYAQGADWAISILYSQQKGMCIIPRSKVYWRYSGDNISSVAPHKKTEMIKGHFQFINWAKKHFVYLKNAAYIISYQMMMDALRLNVRAVMIHHFKGYGWQNITSLYKFLRHDLSLSHYDSVKELIIISEQRSLIAKKMHWLMLRFENLKGRVNNLKGRSS